MRKLNIAILGATGAVGQELLRVLDERDFPWGELRLLASARSAGRTMTVRGRELMVEEAEPASFDGMDIAFFTAGGSVSKALAPAAVEAGAVVIDNTSAFRLHPEVPLVVPEVNGETALLHRGIIANPNCSTILMAVVLKPIYDRVGIQRVVVSTYQAVSGAGFSGMEELQTQVRDYAADTSSRPEVLPVADLPKHYPIAFNAIPQIDVFGDEGYTKEEWKMVRETHKIFGDPSLAVTATAVRLPILRSHCESVNIQTKGPLSAADCRALLAEAPGIEVLDDPMTQSYPMPLDTSGTDPVWVGRIRDDRTVEHGLNLWIVGDQIRKGAALNAVQIAELLGPHIC